MANATAVNRGKPWTPAEDAQLRQLIAEKVSLESIAKRLGRTTKSVITRAYDLGISLKALRHARRLGRHRLEGVSPPVALRVEEVIGHGGQGDDRKGQPPPTLDTGRG